MLFAPQNARRIRRGVMPPFFTSSGDIIDPSDVLATAIGNPHPTDVLLDTSIFSMERLALVREILLNFSGMLLGPVLSELEDLKTNPKLVPLRDLVFPDGVLNPRLRIDDRRVFEAYPRFTGRYINLLRSRREAINVAVRHAVHETGQAPTGKARSKLIQKMISDGIAEETIRLANKSCRLDRIADEALAVFAVVRPIITGRDCFLYTADRDVFEQVIRMSDMLFSDYGAYLIARDFRNDESRYSHRHPYISDLFVGDALAVGRDVHPDYLLPPPNLVKTCATCVVDVARLRSFTWISARNMEIAISFQDQDPSCRKGDPGEGRDIIFTLPVMRGVKSRCSQPFHFGIGTPSLVKVSTDELGPIASFDVFRALMATGMDARRPTRIVSPFAAHQDRLASRGALAREVRREGAAVIGRRTSR